MEGAKHYNKLSYASFTDFQRYHQILFKIDQNDCHTTQRSINDDALTHADVNTADYDNNVLCSPIQYSTSKKPFSRVNTEAESEINDSKNYNEGFVALAGIIEHFNASDPFGLTIIHSRTKSIHTSA